MAKDRRIVLSKYVSDESGTDDSYSDSPEEDWENNEDTDEDTEYGLLGASRRQNPYIPSRVKPQEYSRTPHFWENDEAIKGKRTGNEIAIRDATGVEKKAKNKTTAEARLEIPQPKTKAVRRTRPSTDERPYHKAATEGSAQPANNEVDGIWNPSKPSDVTVHFELDIQHDFSENLEEFTRLSHLGKYGEARKYFSNHLGNQLHRPYFLVCYLECLIEQGDYVSICELYDPDWEVQGRTDEAKFLLFYCEMMVIFAWSFKPSRHLSQRQRVQDRIQMAFQSLETMLQLRTEEIGTTEVRFLSLLFRINSQPHQYLHNVLAGQLSRFFTDESKQIYKWLLRDGRVWDMCCFIKGLTASGQLFQFFTSTFRMKPLQGLQRLISDWQTSEIYDRSTNVALLELLIFIWAGYPGEYLGIIAGVDFLDMATPLAWLIATNSPENMQSRSYVKWMMFKAWHVAVRNTPDQIREHLASHEGFSTLTRWLPQYIPLKTENPGWKQRGAERAHIDMIELAVNTARQMEDYDTESTALIILINLSANPATVFEELCYLLREIQGDIESYVATLVSKFLVCQTEESKAQLKKDLAEQIFVPDFDKSCTCETIWFSSMVYCALEPEAADATRAIHIADAAWDGINQIGRDHIQGKMPDLKAKMAKRQWALFSLHESEVKEVEASASDRKAPAQTVGNIIGLNLGKTETLNDSDVKAETQPTSRKYIDAATNTNQTPQDENVSGEPVVQHTHHLNRQGLHWNEATMVPPVLRTTSTDLHKFLGPRRNQRNDQLAVGMKGTQALGKSGVIEGKDARDLSLDLPDHDSTSHASTNKSARLAERFLVRRTSGDITKDVPSTAGRMNEAKIRTTSTIENPAHEDDWGVFASAIGKKSKKGKKCKKGVDEAPAEPIVTEDPKTRLDTFNEIKLDDTALTLDLGFGTANDKTNSFGAWGTGWNTTAWDWSGNKDVDMSKEGSKNIDDNPWGIDRTKAPTKSKSSFTFDRSEKDGKESGKLTTAEEHAADDWFSFGTTKKDKKKKKKKASIWNPESQPEPAKPNESLLLVQDTKAVEDEFWENIWRTKKANKKDTNTTDTPQQASMLHDSIGGGNESQKDGEGNPINQAGSNISDNRMKAPSDPNSTTAETGKILPSHLKPPGDVKNSAGQQDTELKRAHLERGILQPNTDKEKEQDGHHLTHLERTEGGESEEVQRNNTPSSGLIFQRPTFPTAESMEDDGDTFSTSVHQQSKKQLG